jgi:TonB family protein
MPERIHLVRSIGHGLDEQALLAIKQYRFKPSLKDGVPVPVQITIESNFHMN